MIDPFRKATPGQPWQPSARLHNATLDAIRHVRNQRQLGGGETPAASHETGIVTVKNNSGADRDRLDVLGIDGVLFTPTENADLFKSRVVLKGVTPNASTHDGKFVVLLEPIKNGKLGRAYISGVCPAKVSVASEAHTFANAGGAATSLASGDTGSAKILYKESGTGVKFAVVLLGAGASAATPSVLLKLVSNHAANATYHVYYAARAPVVDPATWVPPVLSSNQAIGININELAADGTATGHQLSTSRLPIFFEGFFEGYSNDATPLPVYRFYGNQIGC